MISPRRRLSLMKRGGYGDEYNVTNKRARFDDGNNENPKMQEKENFMKVCKQVSYEAFQDIRKRFQIVCIPECKNNICNHVSKKISSTAEGCIKIEYTNHSWCDALEVCIICIKSGQCLSGSVLKNIVEIIMNTHEDVNSGYTVDFILRQCQYTLLLNFNMHPPCFESNNRDCYKEFLTSAMDEKKDNTFSNRKQHSSDKGIIAHCFDRLMYEISNDSKDGTICDKNNVIEGSNGVQGLHWKKENQELFEFLDRTERINRLMMVLESTIHLLQTDLALWHRGYHNSNRRVKKSQKPIISYLLWPKTNVLYGCNSTNLKVGTVSLICQQIMKLFAYFIHLQYPEEHINTMSLWMNAVAQIFYICENYTKIDYPRPSTYCTHFSRDFCKIITPLPSPSILRILQRLQPSFMQHLVGECYIRSLPHHIPDKDITNIITSCVEDAIWKKYPGGDGVGVSADNVVKNDKIKLCQLFNYQAKKCKSCKTFSYKSPCTDRSTNLYPKLELDFKVSETKIQRPFFVNVLFITFIAYLEAYNIGDFHRRLYPLNAENINDCDPHLINDYQITEEYVTKYKSIIISIKMLFKLLDGKKDKFSVNLLEILKKYLA